ncbi:hypothetical protein NHX12_000772 [Muraenolepis orangiensis]|uniref:Uncharacterized protein n=1 Tax=Muraenolepis orangiensis TaxID=630683 RepID=A0A9Q0DX05_9TELE|nr:hypothetical protein NHX12_000772 [Muraenolepis orangiensis]
MQSNYSCCDSPLLESDVGNSDEEVWNIGNKKGHMPDKIVYFIGRECPAPPEAIVTSSATRHHYAVCATSANVDDVMKSYSCCDRLLESDAGNSDEESWATGDRVIARYPVGDQPCVPPCKDVSSGRLSLDGSGCPDVRHTLTHMGGEPDKIVDFIGRECPAPPEAIVTSSATRHHYAVMKSYSCCDSPLLESDVGNNDEESWAIGATVIALYPVGDQPCVPPCKNVSPGRLSLDGSGCPDVRHTLTHVCNLFT